MLMLNEEGLVVELTSLYQPMTDSHFWTLNMTDQDFMLSPLQTLEQTTGPVLEINIGSYGPFALPTSWYMLICDSETLQLDVVQIAEMAGREFEVFTCGINEHYPTQMIATAVGYSAGADIISPQLLKNQMLCHPISPRSWMCISPNDGYSRYLKDLTAGHLM